MIFAPFHYKLLNVFLLVGFILSKLTDYATTYIMLSLGCAEGNYFVRGCIEEFGRIKGLAVAGIPNLILVVIVTYYVVRNNSINKQQFALFVLVLIILYSLVITLGNLSGLAMIIHTVKG